MTIFTDKADFQKHILISNLLDVELLEPYIEVALRRKIYPFVPKAIIEKLEKENTELYSLFKKALAHYTIPIAIPFIKVKTTNAGIVHYEDGKTKRVEWWDVRDMSLQCISIADEALTDLIDELLKIDKYKSELKFLDKYENIIFKSPDELFGIIQTGSGYDLFNNLIPHLEFAWLTMIKQQLPDCVFEKLDSDTELSNLLKKATAFYALADAISSGSFVYNQSGLFMIWEQLPWQKSSMYTSSQLDKKTQSYYDKGNQFLKLIFDYLKKNIADYPCMENYGKQSREIIKKKSGLYL